MKTKMTAVAMVAVMIVAAFAVVGMADNGAADNETNTSNGQKTIIGSKEKPYALKINTSTTAKIDYNFKAFSTHADRTITPTYTSNDNKVQLTSIDAKGQINSENLDMNGITASITSIAEKDGSYDVIFTGTTVTSMTECTTINFILTIKDKTADGKELPIQTYTFTAYLIVVDSSKKTIKLSSGPTFIVGKGETFEFKYETAYDFKASVVEIQNTDNGDKYKDIANSNSYNYYATDLPAGLSMTVDGNIGGKLSSTGVEKNGTFHVFAVSVSGDTVTIEVKYTVADHTIRDFTVTYDESNNQYATIRIGESVILTVKPSGTYEMKNLEVTPSGSVKDLNSTLNADFKSGTISFKCEGTGVNVITISAEVDGAKIVKTFTVYIVGEIFNTDLDPEVTN